MTRPLKQFVNERKYFFCWTLHYFSLSARCSFIAYSEKKNKKMDVFTGKMAPLQIRPTKAELHSDVACSVEKGHQNVFNFENEYSQ